MTDNTSNTSPEASDAQIDAEIVKFDPIYDVPSPVKVVVRDGARPLELPEPKLSMLSPQVQAEIREKLKSVPSGNREQFERRFVTEALEKNSLRLRVRAGPGEGANEYQRELSAIANEVNRLNSEALDISTRLAEVSHFETHFDERTGKMSPIAVDRVQGAERKALEARLAQVDYIAKGLEGPEGEKRRLEALKIAREEVKRQRQKQVDQAEVSRRADEKERERRIEAQAEIRSRTKLRPGR